MPLKSFQQQIEQSSGKKLKLIINNNRSTMLSVKWEPDCTKVSLHRIFLNAPANVMESLACYIDKRQKTIAPPIKTFISEKIRSLDYSQQVPNYALQHQGEVYNLKKIFEALNKEYFNNSINLNITWYGTRKNRNKNQITFGLYCSTMKLIKISRLLDDSTYPDYVVSFIIYHEMLHHTCPPYIDEKGINNIHNPEFKRREKEFKYFHQAKLWFKTHQDTLFE